MILMIETIPLGHGGKRTGAGRKTGSKNVSGTKGAAADYAEARARREAALAELAELDLAQRRGELVPADLIQRHWETLAANTRGKLLNLPGRLAASVMGCETLQEAERAAMMLVREALEELAAGGIPHE